MVFGLLKGVLGGRKSAPPSAPAVVDDRAQREADAIAEARTLLDGADLAGARALLEPFAASSHRLDTLMLVARFRVSQGEVDAALELLKTALLLHPNAVELLETAAVAHEMKGQVLDALEAWHRLVFLGPRPSADTCVKWMRAYVRAAKLRQPRKNDVVAQVAARLDGAADVNDEHRLAFAEWLYAYQPGERDAIERYRHTRPAPPQCRDVSAQWMGLDDWCRRSGAPLHRAAPLGEGSEPVSLGELSDVLVIPGFQWIPVVGDGTVALSGFTMHRMKSHRESPTSPQLMSNRARLELRLGIRPRVIEGPALLVGGQPQYYHQTIEYLSVLAVAESLGVGQDLPLVINHDLAPFQREQLRLLGYGEDRLVLVRQDEQVLCRQLLVPTRLVRGGQWMHPLIPHWYRRRMAEPLAGGSTGGRLYVSRRLAARRRIANEEAVKAAVTARGYQVVYPEDLTIAQQLALFSSATHLVAPSGAALTSMVYMPAGGSVLVPVTQYAMSGAGDFYFDALAKACGHHFAWLPGAPVSFRGERLIDADFEVDLGQLAEALDAAG